MNIRWDYLLMPSFVVSFVLLASSQLTFLRGSLSTDLGLGILSPTIGTANYEALFTDEFYLRSLWLTIKVSAIATSVHADDELSRRLRDRADAVAMGDGNARRRRRLVVRDHRDQGLRLDRDLFCGWRTQHTAGVWACSTSRIRSSATSPVSSSA